MKRTPAIDHFLNCKRIAFVGISRNPADFSRALYKELQQRGYDLVPVRADGVQIDGARTFNRVEDITPPVEAALIMTPQTATEEVVRACGRAGIKKVWLHKGVGPGSVTDNALNACKQLGMEVVSGECPMMFLPDTQLFHKVHGFFRHGFTGPRATA